MLISNEILSEYEEIVSEKLAPQVAKDVVPSIETFEALLQAGLASARS